MAEELIYKVGVEGTNELNKLEQSVDKAGKTTNKTTSYMYGLRRELDAVRMEMVRNEKGTDAYNRALARGSQIMGDLKKANSAMKAGIQGMGTTTRNVTGAMVGLAGGFQVVQSAMSLFGVENEETIKTVLKLQQTMSIVQGMASFARGISNAQKLLDAYRASNQQLNEDLKTTGDGMEGVSKSSDKMGDSFKASGKESAVLGSNLAGNTKIADDLNKGLGGLGDGLNTLNTQQLEQSKELIKSNLALLENTKKDIESKIKNASETDRLLAKTARWGKELDDTNLKITEQNKKLSELDEQLTNTGKATGDLSKSQENVKKNSEGAGKGISSFAKTIGKSLVTMGAFLIVIWAVTTAISALVKWLSKVPESVKIKIELEEDVQNQLAKERLEAKKFANDLQLLHRRVNKENKEADKERLKRIREQGKEEMGLTDTQLDNIATVKDGWIDMFEAYLLRAEYTYKKEALMKKKIDAETRIELETASARMKFDEAKGENGKLVDVGTAFSYSFEDLEKKAQNTGIGKWLEDTFLLWKDTQQVVDHLTEAERIRTKELAVIDKVITDMDKDLANVDFGTGLETKETTTTPPTVKTPAGDAPTLKERKPDAVEDDMEIKLMGERLLAKRGLTNEERELEAESARFTDKNQSDSYLRYAEHQQRMAIARDKDLGERKNALEESLAKEEEFYQTQLANQNENLKAVADGHNAELEKLRQFNQIKFDIEEEVLALIKQRQGLDGKTDADEIARIDAKIMAKKELYDENDALIEQSKKEIQTYKDRAKAIEEELKALDASPEKIKLLKDELVDLNLAIADSNMVLKKSIAEVRNAQVDNAKKYIEQIQDVMYDLEAMSNAMMQAEDNKLAKQKNSLEASQAYREADSEQQQQMMYELEEASYAARKKAFDRNKAFQMGQVIVQFAANEMDIIKALLNPATGGPLSPVNIAIAAATTALNLATMTASLKQIASTSLDKPVPPGGGAGGAGGVANIALSPNKTALTSKEENLNSMYKSGKSGEKDTVVKVSEINNVQNRVKVREKNSSY